MLSAQQFQGLHGSAEDEARSRAGRRRRSYRLSFDLNREATPDDFKRGAENMVKGARTCEDVWRDADAGIRERRPDLRTPCRRRCRLFGRPTIRMPASCWIPSISTAGVGKVEDLEMLRDGELAHLHFEDIPGESASRTAQQPAAPAVPRRRHRAFEAHDRDPEAQGIRGPGIAWNCSRTRRRVAQNLDPFQLASRAKAAIEPL